MLKRALVRWNLSRRRGPAPNRGARPGRPALEQLEDRCLLAADPVLEWNAVALDAVKNDSYLGADAKQAGPTRTSRALAIVQAAVFDAVNSIEPSYQPYLIQVNAPPGASITAAVAQAAHDTLVSLYPDYEPALDAQLATDLAQVSSPAARAGGVQVGQAVAAATLAARADDGSNAAMAYTPGTGPGQWQPDPYHPDQQAVGSLWGDVTPFALASPEQFTPPPPPKLKSKAYTDAFNEVKDYGSETSTLRTPEETTVAVFWAYDGSPGLGTPPRLYNQIAETLAVQEGNTVVQNARFFALINIAMADAGIASWDAKYDYDFWRPVTAIQDAAADGNPNTVADPTWRPLGAPADNAPGNTNFTPPFPAYVSGHATFGGALFETMADFFGRDDIHFTIGSDEFNGVTADQDGQVRPVVTRSFDSFSQAAQENAQSRIYLGIHWSFDKTAGIKLGDQVADYVFHTILKPRQNGGGHGQGAGQGTGQGHGQGNGPASDTAVSQPGPSGADQGRGQDPDPGQAQGPDGRPGGAAAVLASQPGTATTRAPAAPAAPATATGAPASTQTSPVHDAAVPAGESALGLDGVLAHGGRRTAHSIEADLLLGSGDVFKAL